jgi:hypothetical protein
LAVAVAVAVDPAVGTLMVVEVVQEDFKNSAS